MSVLNSSSLLLSRRDVAFVLTEVLNVGALCERARFAGQTPDEYEAILELAERMATERFAPNNRRADTKEPVVRDDRVELIPEIQAALTTYAEAGLIGANMDAGLGGLQIPTVVTTAVRAWFCAANIGTTNYALLTAAAAAMLCEHGSPEQVAEWVPPMLSGRYHGTMCLTEPQAGSSLADVRTSAEPQPDGTYRLTGTKMWISGGEHEMSENILHLTLARVPGAPDGVRGISLFIVPRRVSDPDGRLEANDIALAGLNHKMGQRGTVNTVLSFGEGVHRPGGRPGAVGYLVGEASHGLDYMFSMMDEARLAVGMAATALGYTGYLKACQYARERPQGRPVGQPGPGGQQVPIIEHTDVRRMLLASKSYVEGGLALVLYCARLADDSVTLADPAARREARALLGLLTPIAKSWPSEWCLKANSLAIQIHGGYGYSVEYDIEQHYRDNRLNAIHEGTHGIQAIDLLGRKVRRDGGAVLALLSAKISETAERAASAGAEASELAFSLVSVLNQHADVSASLIGMGDATTALADASLYLQASGHLVVGWLWLEQFLAVGDRGDAFGQGKRQAARYFICRELPTTAAQLDVIDRGDNLALDMCSDWF